MTEARCQSQQHVLVAPTTIPRLRAPGVAHVATALSEDEVVQGYALPAGNAVIEYPGVYLAEFAPGQPILGVPTAGGSLVRWSRWPL